jgi:hypothetical protein
LSKKWSLYIQDWTTQEISCRRGQISTSADFLTCLLMLSTTWNLM